MLKLNLLVIRVKKEKSGYRKPEETKLVQKKVLRKKQKVMEADGPTMDALGLRYDYANLDLTQVVQAYLPETGIEQSQVAFSYKDLTTGKTFAVNDTQPMTAGSTYKLPLNMLVVDEEWLKENCLWKSALILPKLT